MKLNDPFNRLYTKQQSEYQSFRETLKNTRINSHADARLLINKINTRALYFILLILGIATIVILIIPKLKVMVIIFAVLALLWVFSSTLKGKMYLRRYINEEFSDN